MDIQNKLKFKVYDKKKKKLYSDICGLGIDSETGKITLVDLYCDSNVGDWAELGEEFELRAYLNGKRLQ